VFVIFGFQRKPRRLATIRSMCASCLDRGAQELFSVRTRLRLFFVPAVPLPTIYRTTCGACGTSSTVSAEKADQLLASAPRVDELPVTQGLVARGSAAA
jgi:hypothetical protein